MKTGQRLEKLPADVFQAIVEQAPDAVIYADCIGVIQIWNRGAEAVFGYAAEEVLEQSMDIIVPERFRHAHWEGYRRAIETGQTKYAGRVMTTRATHKSGSKLYVDVTFGLVKDQAGMVTGVLAIGRDCTKQHLSDRKAAHS